jgi:predicted ArsR family transcriptional regulator
MTTSRQRVNAYIQNRKAATAEDISQALGMTAANARHHLTILRDQGVIEIIGQRPNMGKGRPSQVYGATIQAAEDSLGRLTSALLAEIKYLQSPDAQSQSLERISKRLTSRSNRKDQHLSAHLTQRLYDAIQQLNQSNYQARWEAHIAAPQLILGHCPFKSIIDSHPELCKIDALMLESLLDEPVEQLAKLSPDVRGAPVCVFQIGSNY